MGKIYLDIFCTTGLGSPEENLSSKGIKTINAKNKTPNMPKTTI